MPEFVVKPVAGSSDFRIELGASVTCASCADSAPSGQAPTEPRELPMRPYFREQLGLVQGCGLSGAARSPELSPPSKALVAGLAVKEEPAQLAQSAARAIQASLQDSFLPMHSATGRFRPAQLP